jgi:hypothetical protein
MHSFMLVSSSIVNVNVHRAGAGFPDPCLPHFQSIRQLRDMSARGTEVVHIDYAAQFKVRGGGKASDEGPASRVGGYSETHLRKVWLV